MALPFEHVSELFICSLISSHPPRIPVKTGLQKLCVRNRACIERSDLWMARLLFMVLLCPQVRTKPHLSIPNLSENTLLRDTSSKSFCTDLPNRSVIRDSGLVRGSFLVQSPSRVACLFVPYLDKAVNFSGSFMRYGRHFNRVTWLLVNAHLPARLDSNYLQLAKGFSAKKLITGAYRVLAILCWHRPPWDLVNPSQDRGETDPQLSLSYTHTTSMRLSHLCPRSIT